MNAADVSGTRLGGSNMIPEPAVAIKREVLQLIDLQIATLGQESVVSGFFPTSRFPGALQKTPRAIRRA
jgi:hypothetical protein